MKAKWARVLLVIGAVAMVLTSAGCKGAATPTEPGVAVEPTSGPAAGAEPVKISVYTVTWSASSQKMMADLVAMFNEDHKGAIEAELIQGDGGVAESYLTAGIAGGGGIADVMEWGTEAKGWYEQGFIDDLRPYLTPEVRALMPEELWASRTADDGAVFMGGTVSGEEDLIFYNPALFAAAGIEPPAVGTSWTWDEFTANAKKLTLDAAGKHLGEAGFDPNNVVQWGYLPRLDSEKVWEQAANFAIQATGKTMIRQGTDGTWDIFFDDAAMPALRNYFSVITEGITPTWAIGMEGETQNEAFAQGKGAMILRGFFNGPVLHDLYPDFGFAVMTIPMAKGSNYYLTNIGQGLFVTKTSKNPAAAAEFVFWFLQPKPQAMFASALGLKPCNPVAFDDPILKDDPNWAVMRYLMSIEKLVVAPYNTNQNEFVTTLYAPNMVAVVEGKQTLEEAITKIKAGSVEMLNQK